MAMKIKGIITILGIFVLLTISSYALQPIESNGGTVTTAEEFVTALGGDDAAYFNGNNIILKSDITLTAPIVITEGEYIINGTGCYIYLGKDIEAMFIVEGEDTKLILGNDKGSDDHPSLSLFGNGKKGGAVILRNSNLDIYSGTLISGFKADNGAGLNIDDSIVNIYGGVFEYCEAINGGAMCLESGEITIYRGLINYCKADNGGAIAIHGGTLYSGLCTFGYNEAMNGGAVFVGGGGEFYMTNGSLEYNKASDGGAVYIMDGSFYFLGGYIVYNDALENGGAIYNNGIYSSGKLNINNQFATPLIYNTAANGAAVYNSGEFEYENGDMTYNTASECAGGIYNTGTVKMTGGSISMNESEGRCGGVMNLGKFIMSDGSISSNKSASTAKGMENWGELYLAGYCFISFNNDVIIGNRAKVEIVTPLIHLTATTPVATFTPVSGYFNGDQFPDYEIGRVIVTGDAEVLQAAFDNDRLAVTSGKDGTWFIDAEGTLQFKKNPFNLNLIIMISLIVLVIVIMAIMFIRNMKRKRLE